MNNSQFLKLVKKSFVRFLETSARSNEKLKILHGGIATDLKNELGKEYSIKSLGLEEGKEGKLIGRYMEKVVDILISKNENDIAAIGVKFVMNNYSQNSNNYFENMLGETANLRANKKKYFQIIVIPEEMPYYNNDGKITRWERVTDNNINKYIALSKDNTEIYIHTPIKTLLFIVKFPACNHTLVTTKSKYKKYYLKIKNKPIKISANITGDFGEAIILNSYEDYIKKVIFYLKSL